MGLWNLVPFRDDDCIAQHSKATISRDYNYQREGNMARTATCAIYYVRVCMNVCNKNLYRQGNKHAHTFGDMLSGGTFLPRARMRLRL